MISVVKSEEIGHGKVGDSRLDTTDSLPSTVGYTTGGSRRDGWVPKWQGKMAVRKWHQSLLWGPYIQQIM